MQQYTLTRDLRENGLNSLRLTEYQYFETEEDAEHFTTAIIIEGSLPTTIGTCTFCRQQGFLLGGRCMAHKRPQQLLGAAFAGMVDSEDYPAIYLWQTMKQVLEDLLLHTEAHMHYMGAWIQDYRFKIILYTCFDVQEMEEKLIDLEWTAPALVMHQETNPTTVWVTEDAWHELYKMEFLCERPRLPEDDGMAAHGQMPLYLTTNLN